MDSVIETVHQDQSRVTLQLVLNVILLARLVLNIPANVLLARVAVETSSTTNVLISVQLVHIQSMEHVNIVHTPAKAVWDLTLLVLLVPTERFSTQGLAMTNALT